MFRRQTNTVATKTKHLNKVVAGFAAVATTAVIAAGGLAAAAPSTKPSKAQCQQAGFMNYGQCVKEWAQHKNHPGNGYGGGNNSVAVNLTLDHSNNNIIQVIVNIFR